MHSFSLGTQNWVLSLVKHTPGYLHVVTAFTQFKPGLDVSLVGNVLEL